jgi:rubrerythrin
VYAEIHSFLANSGRISTAGIDYEAAARIGLSSDEVFALTYFADVENQSLRYLRTLLTMRVAFEPEVAAFLATWNYEEFFHGFELEQLLRACNVSPEPDRRQKKHEGARLNERVEALLLPLLSRLYEADFPAVYFTFGALQELTTLRGYEGLGARSRNPALSLLCSRIAKQERRHFAWYFRRARRVLEGSARARFLTRQALRFNWVPVGAGVHDDAEVARLFRVLFYPRERARAVVAEIDRRVERLPGLAGLGLMKRYFEAAGQL